MNRLTVATTRRIAAIALLTVGAATSEAAAQLSYTSYTGCGRTVRVCSSIQLMTYWDGHSTQVAMRVRNLDGQVPGGVSTYEQIFGVHVLNAAGSNVFGSVNSPLTIGTEGSVQKLGGANYAAVWGVATGTNFWGTGAAFLSVQEQRWDDLGGLFGCSYSPINYGISTCAPLAQASWLTFSFSTTGQWAAKDMLLTAEWDFGATCGALEPSGGYNWIGGCDPENLGLDPMVTPEPMTIVLLGSGLLGLGAAHRRRKRDLDA